MWLKRLLFRFIVRRTFTTWFVLNFSISSSCSPRTDLSSRIP
jgi:hypothetical protein